MNTTVSRRLVEIRLRENVAHARGERRAYSLYPTNSKAPPRSRSITFKLYMANKVSYGCENFTRACTPPPSIPSRLPSDMPHRARMRHPSLEGLSNRPRRPTVRWRRHRGSVKKSIFYSSVNGIRRLFRRSLFLKQNCKKVSIKS